MSWYILRFHIPKYSDWSADSLRSNKLSIRDCRSERSSFHLWFLSNSPFWWISFFWQRALNFRLACKHGWWVQRLAFWYLEAYKDSSYYFLSIPWIHLIGCQRLWLRKYLAPLLARALCYAAKIHRVLDSHQKQKSKQSCCFKVTQ